MAPLVTQTSSFPSKTVDRLKIVHAWSDTNGFLYCLREVTVEDTMVTVPVSDLPQQETDREPIRALEINDYHHAVWIFRSSSLNFPSLKSP